MRFHSGELMTRAEIRNPVDKNRRDARGSTARNYRTDGVAWFGITPIASDERETGDQQAGVATHTIIGYHNSKITQRTVLRTVVSPVQEFEVVGLENVEMRDRWLRLTCRELQ